MTTLHGVASALNAVQTSEMTCDWVIYLPISKIIRWKRGEIGECMFKRYKMFEKASNAGRCL